MITLQETLNDQKNLYKLCTKRGNPTVDAVRFNGFYGHGDVYKQYAGLPYEHQLNGIVPHAVATGDRYWSGLNSFPVPYIYCFPAYRQRGYRERTNKKIIPSAAPFAYVYEMLKNQPKPEKRGTLFFPAHSTKFVTVKQDYNKLAEKLLLLDTKYHPITVCLYWKDVLLGAAEPFLSREIEVVSAGHMYDRLFLYRLYHLCSIYKYASSNIVGSHIFYSVKTGCSYFTTNFEYHHVARPKILKRNVYFGDRRKVKIAKAFKVSGDAPTQSQLELTHYYLGVENLKTKRGLRRDLCRT